MQKRLYRSRTQKVFAGVCGGIAEYFNIDVTLIRLVWVVLTLPGFFPGIILYIIAAIIIPESSQVNNSSEQHDFENVNTSQYESYNENWNLKSSNNRNSALLVIGLILIAIGAFSLFKDLFPHIWSTFKEVAFPIGIIVIGGAIIYSATKK